MEGRDRDKEEEWKRPKEMQVNGKDAESLFTHIISSLALPPTDLILGFPNGIRMPIHDK